MTKCLWGARLKEAAVCGLLRILAMLPFAPSAYAFYRVFPQCIAFPEGFGCQNLLSIMLLAPIAVLIGPITHDEEDPINPWPGVFLTAALMATAWWGASQLLRIGIRAVRRRRSPPIEPTS
jgi:hypothetical protein